MRWELHAAAIAVLALACGQGNVFSCADDAECSGGVCQSSGFCSFPSDSCDSGQRYGEHAAGGLAGQCVELAATETSMAPPPTLPSETTTGPVTPPLDSSGVDPGSTGVTGEPAESSSTGEPVDPDLLLWFRFEDLPGDFTVDAVGGLSATCQGRCPGSTAGPRGQAALFDGDGGFDVPFGPRFELTQAFTIALWVRPDLVAGMERRMVFGHPFGTDIANAWLLYVRPNALVSWDTGMSMSSVDTNHLVISSLGLDLGEWVHLAGTYDRGQMRLFVDGQPIGTNFAPPPLYDEDYPITIGYDINMEVPDGQFVGAIDDVRLYARALDSDELLALANR